MTHMGNQGPLAILVPVPIEPQGARLLAALSGAGHVIRTPLDELPAAAGAHALCDLALIAVPADDPLAAESLCRRARATIGASALLLAVLAPDTGRAACEGLLAAGADDFLDWPLEADALSLRLRVVSGLARSRRDLFHAERMLGEARARSTAILETAADGIVTIDESGIVTSLNAAAARLFGYAPADVVGRNVSLLMPSPDRERHDGYLRAYAAGGPAKIIGVGRDVEGRRRDGSTFPLRLAVSVVSGHGPDAYAGILHDLSEQKRREDELRAAREATLQVIEGAADGVITIDAAGVVRSFNAAAVRLFGYTPAEVIGHNVSMLMPAPDKQQHDGYLRAYQTGGPPRIIGIGREVSGQRKDGSTFPLHLAVSEVGVGGQVSYTAILHDLTLQKRTEAELRAAHDAALLNAAAKSEFLANMSHEIRTPMNGVLGMLQIAMNLPMAPEIRESIEGASHSAESLLGIIDEVLNLSKLEAGKVALDTSEFELAAVLDDSLRVVSASAAAKRLSIRRSLDVRLPAVLRGDPTRLRQVLINLLGNAVKFTNAGSVSIDVARAAEDGSQVRVRLTVSDTGIGIRSDRFDRLFRSFSQIDSSRTRGFGGTGLGLAISQRLVELMGGTIELSSEPGRGSTFWFTIPLMRSAPVSPEGAETPMNPARGPAAAASPASAARAPAAALPAASEPRAPLSPVVALRPCDALLVEDNVVNMTVARKLLELLGARVDVAVNGREAVAACERRAYDLILMDLHMPEMDGYQATRAIRLRESETGLGRHTPIVALTASVMPSDREQCQGVGMDDFLSKPVRIPALRSVLERWALGGGDLAVPERC